MKEVRCVNTKCNKLLYKQKGVISGSFVVKCTKCGTVNESIDGKLQNYSLHMSRNVLESYQNNLKLNKKNG